MKFQKNRHGLSENKSALPDTKIEDILHKIDELENIVKL